MPPTDAEARTEFLIRLGDFAKTSPLKNPSVAWCLKILALAVASGREAELAALLDRFPIRAGQAESRIPRIASN